MTIHTERLSKKSIINLIVLFGFATLMFNFYHSQIIVSDFNIPKHVVRLHNQIFSEDTGLTVVKNFDESLIVTPGCTLPRTNIMPKVFHMRKNMTPDCGNEIRLLSIEDVNETIKLTENATEVFENKQCKLIEVLRNPKGDSFEYGREYNITKDKILDVSDKELFLTKCNNYVNFDAHFPVTPAVKHKIDHWNDPQRNTKGPPFSVLFIGFDTTSRSHFHRSLQRTLPLMNSMGFIDFQGYHSVAPYTLENFLAFIVGMKTPDIRKRCAGNWSTPFDTCPQIWKHYDLNKFITMFIEDGSGTFNWGRQGGFAKKPTDYYPHPLMRATSIYRRNVGDKEHVACLSNQNAQHFILEYNKRFLTKFIKNPFFSFTWFANPFHNSIYSLFGFDDSFHDFFQFLNSPELKELRERTLIILNSDHGQRSCKFVRSTYEGFIERALVGLFIRLPDNLAKRFPELNIPRNLKLNSRRLVGGFDIYHTLLHLLHMQNLLMKLEGGQISNLNLNDTATEADFSPVLPDRSSLFVPVSDKWNCDDVNVYNGTCVCNATSQVSLSNPFFTNKMVNFAFKELNGIVSRSKYRGMCRIHKKPFLTFVGANILFQTVGYLDTLLRFLSNVDRAEFEVRLRVYGYNKRKEGKSRIGKIKRISSFNRLTLYGNTSWCVGFETDEDKKMKEICHCL